MLSFTGRADWWCSGEESWWSTVVTTGSSQMLLYISGDLGKPLHKILLDRSIYFPWTFRHLGHLDDSFEVAGLSNSPNSCRYSGLLIWG